MSPDLSCSPLTTDTTDHWPLNTLFPISSRSLISDRWRGAELGAGGGGGIGRRRGNQAAGLREVDFGVAAEDGFGEQLIGRQ